MYIPTSLPQTDYIPFTSGNVVINTSTTIKIILNIEHSTKCCNTIGDIYLFIWRIILVNYMFIWLRSLNFIYANISIIGYELPEMQDFVGSQPKLCFSGYRHTWQLWSQWCYLQWPYFTCKAILLMRPRSGHLQCLICPLDFGHLFS